MGQIRGGYEVGAGGTPSRGRTEHSPFQGKLPGFKLEDPTVVVSMETPTMGAERPYILMVIRPVHLDFPSGVDGMPPGLAFGSPPSIPASSGNSPGSPAEADPDR